MKFTPILLFFVFFGLLGINCQTYGMSSCVTNADCDNGHGYCVPIISGGPGFCSCCSGFAGANCSVRPDASCTSSFQAVDPTTAQFTTTASINYNYPTFLMTFTGNLQESQFMFPEYNDTLNSTPYSTDTVITFGDGVSTDNCTFPNGGAAGVNWTTVPVTFGNCQDTYTTTISWDDAKNKCGFTDLYGNKTFTQTVYITRNYTLTPDPRNNLTVTSSETSSHVLSVVFPTSVSLTLSNIQVTGSIAAVVSITLVNYNPATDLWELQLQTSVQGPYELYNPQPSALNGSIFTNNRVQSGTATITNLTSCNNNNLSCEQQTTVYFVQGSAVASCDGLSGTLQVIYNLTCEQNSSSECPLTGNETLTIQVSLNTGDSCPVIDTITFSSVSLASYSDPGCTTPETSFITTQTAYFGAVIQSTDASILSLTVQPSGVCFQIGTDACSQVNFTQLSPANGKNPIFSVDFLGSPTNQQIFGNLTSSLINAERFNIEATVLVLWTGATTKKRDYNIAPLNLVTSVDLSNPVSTTQEMAASSAPRLQWFGMF